MKVLLGVPSADYEGEARTLWQELTSKVSPFPVDVSDADLEVFHGRCDDLLLTGDEASATLVFDVDALPDTTRRIPRLCLGQQLFARPHEIQLAVLLHEIVHIRLNLGRLRKHFSRGSQLEEGVGYQVVLGDEIIFAEARNRVAFGLLGLVDEIGVDRFMATQYAWLSTDYWDARHRNFYLDAQLIADKDISLSLRPYAAFYRLVALDLGLMVLKASSSRDQLVARRAEYVDALATTCDEETASWLERSRIKLLAFDPIPIEPDPDAYDELCERVLALTA